MKQLKVLVFVLIVFSFSTAITPQAKDKKAQVKEIKAGETKEDPKEKLLDAMHSISSHDLFDYVKEMCKEKYAGRLTGTPEYNASAQWLADKLAEWDVKPGGDNGTFFQDFPNPYTLVFEGSRLILHVPVKKKQFIEKHYRYQDEFFPGSTSAAGEVKAEVVYVGYGITAPELKYDEYKGLDVKGKIVLLEREIPVSPKDDPEKFKKWRPYSFHQYKVNNARKHGAAAVLYNYHIVNPNCSYFDDLMIGNVGKTVVNDLFAGTGKTHKTVIEKIKAKLKPQSFRTRKTMTIKNKTEHHAEGIGRNVIGLIEGSDPELKNEYIFLAAHLDHLGMNHEMMPGANDNASGVAVIMEVARAIKESGLKPKRSILFLFFGAEEQGVAGSDYYLKHPTVPIKQVKALLNLDGVGRGKKLWAIAGKKYPELFKYIDDANNKYIHRKVVPTDFHNLARPRLDAARFMWAGVPTLSFGAGGAEKLPYATYHTTHDNPDLITPEIMEDLAQMLFVATVEMCGY